VFETLSILPISFWAAAAVLVAGGVWAVRQMDQGFGIPVLAVLGTIAAWYVGDAFYNDYANNHAHLFTPGTLQGAWWQVAWFLAVFLLLTPPVHQWINHSCRSRRSGVLLLFNHGIDQPIIQRQLNALFAICAAIWAVLFVIAVFMLKGEVIHYLFPFWGYKASPWSHARLGAGLDFLSILGVYLNLLVAAMFGVVAALATDARIRRWALFLCLLTWPYFIFDRTRNTMLALVIPTVLCWVFLRLRGGLWKKLVILLACYLVVNAWMKFVISNRSQMSIAAAFEQKGFDLAGQKNVHNEGLNMFEELCWISTFLDSGSYHVNWGARYFAELINPIPRSLWHGKPLIGIDYAIVRGQGGAGASAAGVFATISTGVIGEGVVNFGRILGPVAAAFLMSLWVAVLARLDLNVHALGRLPLYSLGLILTFNLGRDITLITLYPFVFGVLAIWALDHFSSPATGADRLPAAALVPDGRTPAPNRQPALPFVWRGSHRAFIGKPLPAPPGRRLGGAPSDIRPPAA
jgi:hypothetical protein